MAYPQKTIYRGCGMCGDPARVGRPFRYSFSAGSFLGRIA